MVEIDLGVEGDIQGNQDLAIVTTSSIVYVVSTLVASTSTFWTVRGHGALLFHPLILGFHF